MKNIKFIALFIFLLMLTACAKQGGIDSADMTSEGAEILWETMLNNTPVPTPLLSEGTLRIKNDDESHRLSYILWGNKEIPIRLDLSIMGTMVAQLREADTDVTLSLPRDKKAFKSRNTIEALAAFNILMPMNLHDLKNMLQGIFVIANKDIEYTYISPEFINEKTIYYTYHVQPNIDPTLISAYPQELGIWQLDKFARPVIWYLNAWKVEFLYEGDKREPYRIISFNKMTNETLTVYINQTKVMPEYSPKSLQLIIPSDFEYLQK